MVIGFRDGEKLKRSELEVKIGQSFLLKCLLKLRADGLIQEERVGAGPDQA